MFIAFLVILSVITYVSPKKATCVEVHDKEGEIIGYRILGYSRLGMPIKSYAVNPDNYNKTILLTFAMHGFEDAWDRDGQALVEIGTDVLLAFSENPQTLKRTRLIVIPCVNPDGTWYGQKSEGFGRCNASGIDINRDFDYFWTYCQEARYRTGKTAFSTPEAQILKEVVLAEKPDIILDFHGWLNCAFGDEEISDYFHQAFGLQHLRSASTDNGHIHQSFAGWGGQYARTVLVEYPNPGTYQKMLSLEYSQKTVDIIKEICKSWQ